MLGLQPRAGLRAAARRPALLRARFLRHAAGVFERGARYTAIVNEGVVQEFVHGRRIGIAMRYTGVKRLDDRHQIEFWLASLLRMCRQHHRHAPETRAGAPVSLPRQGATRSSRNSWAARWSSVRRMTKSCSRARRRSCAFSTRIRTSTACWSTCASRRWRASGVRRARSRRASRMRSRRCCRMARRAPRIIAAEFGMSQRTFARRLADEGLTFSQSAGSPAPGSGASLPDQRGTGRLQGRVVAGLPGGRRVLACVPSLDRKVAERIRAARRLSHADAAHCP